MENKMEKNVKVLMTYNYKLFKFIKGNRPVVPSKINNLVKSYNGGLNLFPFCPVLINKDNYVIDGQHRLEACKKLKIPVYYMVIPEVTLLQIAQMNATATRWKTSDFFNCFIQTGNPDYSTLQLFKDKWSLSINMSVQLLMYGSLALGGKGGEAFKSGKFVVNHLDGATKIMKAVHDYTDVADEKLLSDRNLIHAIHTLMSSDLYKHKEVVEKLKRVKARIEHKDNYKQYIFHIEELFNLRNSKRQFIYQAPKTK